MTKSEAEPTAVVSSDREHSVSSDLVFAALTHSARAHSAYLVFRALESLSGTDTAPTNARLRDMLDYSRSTVKRALGVLEALGLVAREFDAASGLRRLRLFPYTPEWHRAVLRALLNNFLTIDLKTGAVTVTETAQPLRGPGVHQWTGGPPMDPGSTSGPGVPIYGTVDAATTYAQTADAGSETGIYGAICSNEIVKYKEQDQIQSQKHIAPKIDAGPSGRGRPKKPVTADMRLVFDGWALATGSRLKALASGSRMASKLRARLDDGFTPDELILVAQWAAKDPWMSGKHPQNKKPYLTIETLYRSTDKTAGYVDTASAWHARGRTGVYDRRAVHLAANDEPTTHEQF